ASTTPVLITLVSVHVFRERPPHGTWLALAVSFAGVLLIVRPGSGVFSWPALLPLLTAFGFAAYQLMTSRLAGVDDRMATLFIGALVGTAVLSVAAPFVWTWQIDPMHAALLVALGGIAAFAHWLIISAYEHAQASTLAPFVYSQVIATLSLGWLVFGDFPDRWSIAGMALITGTGVALALRNRPRPVLSAPRR
ncbi:MAG TPA: DMT family transporter, partial [Burkholderiaceae bacterium]|nr:DMT family transporter [Burkholderiaceae bacterium]